MRGRISKGDHRARGKAGATSQEVNSDVEIQNLGRATASEEAALQVLKHPARAEVSEIKQRTLVDGRGARRTVLEAVT